MVPGAPGGLGVFEAVLILRLADSCALAVTPGQVHEYAIEIRETSHVFKAGHRVQLLIKAQDAPWEGTNYVYRLSLHLPRNEAVTHRVHHTPERPSYLLLPVIPPKRGSR